ncbi:hypothetical protein [uncultured Tateyamaria sp.]|uniref:hypothetical protein n=1 Tax=Tateyamaria sp. 1078 TaxID=3417464 RepID=UPI0026284151|nr:hypothetical protein [uncultured Tateyamaria sp.]
MGKKFLFVLVLAGAAIAIFVTNGPGLPTSRQSTPFLPVVHPDGTKEFRLVNAGVDQRKGTLDDEEWVLRMPEGLWAKSRDEGRTARQIEENPNYPYNLNFSFVLKLPGLDFMPSPFEEVRYDRAMITVHAGQEPYGSGAFEGGLENPFSVKHDLRANYNCRRDAMVGPGVYALRSTTEAEAAEMVLRFKDRIQPAVLRRFSPPECNRPLSGALRQEYAIYDKRGHGVGFGTCVALKSSDLQIGPKGTCNFRFWLPIDREFSVGLRSEYVPVVQSLYLRVVDILKDATDTTESKNAGTWGNRL